MTYYVNLANGAVTQALFDGAHQPSGWVTKTEGEDSVQICFHLNQVPVLLAAGVPVLLGIKAFGQFSEAYLTSVTGFTAPATPGQYNFYTAGLLNNTVPINLALGSTDGGQTPGDVPMIAQTTCEIEWWLNGPTNPPSKSLTFSVEIDNTPNRGNETAPGNTTPYPAPAAVATAVTQAAAATAYGYANYAAMAAGAVDSAIRGKTASFTSLAGVGTQNFFSTYNPSTHTYTRNPACVFSWPSWASVGNSADVDGTGGNRGCVVMISPTQGITAHHYEEIYAAGVTHDFLGSDGATYTLDIATSVQIGTTDVQLVTFSAPAPAAVGIAPVLAPGVMAQIFGVGTPVVATNQQKQAVVLEMASVPPTNSGNEIFFRAATASNRTAWTVNPPAIPGDSSSPIWAYLDGTPCFVSDWHIGTVNPSSGPSIAECASLINAATAAGTSLSVLPTNTLGLGTAAYAALGTTAGQVPVLNANNQIDPGLLPASAAGGITYVEQTWDGTANVTVNPATTVLRLTTGTPGTQHTITLPASPANGQTLEIVVPPSTGTPATDPVTGGAAQFKVTPANLAIAADPAYTRVFRLIAGSGGWAIDESLVRQNTSASFVTLSTPAAFFTGDVAFESGTTIHGSQGTAFGFAVLCVNGAAQFTPVTLAPGQAVRLNAAGTALEAYTAGFTATTQNLVLASPDGASGVPSLRSLVAADLPNTITPSNIQSPGALSLMAAGVGTVFIQGGAINIAATAGGVGISGIANLEGGGNVWNGSALGFSLPGSTTASVGLSTTTSGVLLVGNGGNGNGAGSLQLGASGTPVALHRVITGTLSAGTVTLSDANITAASRCLPTNEPSGYSGAIGVPYVSAQAAGTVTITSSNSAAANPISVIIEN